MEKRANVRQWPFLALWIVPLLLAGCFGSHGNSPDAGPRPDSGPDARPGWDGAICDCFCSPAVPRPCGPGGSCGDDVCPRPCDCCDGTVSAEPWETCEEACDETCGDTCAPAPADLLCDFSHVVANTPTTIPVVMQGCFCVGSVTCSAEITGDRVLELSTMECIDPDVDCDGCVPFLEGSCDLPPLAAGPWRIDINGHPALDLEVTPEDVLPERGSVCIRRGERDESCGVSWPPAEMHPSHACHPLHAWPNERVAITLEDPCGGCGVSAGPCKVDVFDDVIRVQPSALHTLCDIACPTICTPREDVCWTPRLEEGTWRIIVEGIDGYESTLQVGREPIPGEVCGPFFPHG